MPDSSLFSGSIPANYDKYLGPYLFEPYAIDLAARILYDECKTLLELACGTGRVTNHLLTNLDKEGRIMATDINADMLEMAKTKMGDSRLTWIIADAQELPFEDESFNAVICQFGIMFFPDKLKALKEAYRVLSKNGKIFFNTWGSLADNQKAGLIKEFLEDVFKEHAPDFLEKGPYSLYDPDLIKTILTDAGFKNVVIEQVKKGTTYASADDYVNGFVDGTPLSAFLQKKEPAVREEVKQKLKEAFHQKNGNNLQSEMLALVCMAEKA